MEKMLKYAFALVVGANACSPNMNTESSARYGTYNEPPGSVSPRSEKRFTNDFIGSQSNYGSASGYEFKPRQFRTREEQLQAIENDSIKKEFAVDGMQVNEENFNNDIFSLNSAPSE